MTSQPSSWALPISVTDIGYLTAVADLGDIRVEQGADYEAGSELDIKAGGGGINDGAYAYGHIGTFAGGELYTLGKDLVCEITPVSELEGAYATLVAGPDDLLGYLCV